MTRAPTPKPMLSWLLYLFGAGLFGTLLVFALNTEREKSLEQQGEWLKTLTRVIDKNLSNQLELADKTLDTLRTGGYLHPGTMEELAATLPGIRTILKTDANGITVAANRSELLGRDFSTREYFLEAKAHPSISTLYLSAPSQSVLGVTVINGVKMIPDELGHFNGIVVVSFDPEYYKNLLDSVRDRSLSWARLYHGAGFLYLNLTETKTELVDRKVEPGSDFALFDQRGLSTWLLTDVDPAKDQRPRMTAFRKIQTSHQSLNYPLVVEIGQDLGPFKAAWDFISALALGIFVVVAGLAALLLWFLQIRQSRFRSQARHYDALIRESSMRFQLATEAARLGVWEWNPGADVLTWDDQMFTLYGVQKEEFQPNMSFWLNLIVSEDRIKAESALKTCVETQEASLRMFRIERKDGEVRWIQCNARYHRHNGTEARLIGINDDVTQRVRSAASLIEREKFLRTVTETTPTMIAYYSREERCMFANTGYSIANGHAPQDILGLSLCEVLGEALYQKRLPIIQQVLAGVRQEFQSPNMDAQGNSNYLWLHYIPDIQEGVVQGFFILVDDISELRTAQLELEAQQGKLILNARMAQMGELLSLIAHQWRQPLTVISALVGNIQLRSQLGSLDTEYLLPKLEKMSQTVQFLSSTIESFRNFYAPSKRRDKTNLAELTKKALELLSPVFHNHTHEIRFSAPEQVLWAPVYQAELMQVIIEILGNARKALEAKPGWIALQWTQAEDFAVLAISNNGGVIPPDVLPDIFLPYFTTKVDGTGTGLGLYMAKVIVESHHGGRLEVQCHDDVTTFRIVLPMKEEQL